MAGSRVFAPISASLGEAYLATTSQLGIHQNTVGKSRTNQNMVEKSRNTSKYGGKIKKQIKIRWENPDTGQNTVGKIRKQINAQLN